MNRFPAENPALALGADRLADLRRRDGLAIVAVAGRDSIAAAVAAQRAEGFSAVLPTTVYTGTEFGDEDAPLRAVELLRELLPDAEVLEPVGLTSPGLWSALNGRYAAEIQARWHVCSPCLACHLYVHLARVPLALALGGVPVVTGERDTHDGRVKLSQTRLSIDAETRVLANAGVRLLTPLRSAWSEQIDELVSGAWPQGGIAELSCLHSGNYKALDGTVRFDEAAYSAYIRSFFEPAGLAIVDAWRDDAEPDYFALVAEVLSR